MEDSEMVNEEDAKADKVLKHPLFNDALALAKSLSEADNERYWQASPMPKVIMHKTRLVLAGRLKF